MRRIKRDNKARTIFWGIISILLILLIFSNIKYIIAKKQIQDLKEDIINVNNKNIALREEIDILKEQKNELENELWETKKELFKKNIKVVYDSKDVTKKSNVTYNQLYFVLENTNMKSIVKYIIEAEEVYDVNALFLTGLIANETGYGCSRRYKEDNNVGGYEVYTPDSKGRAFSSKKESVHAVAKLLKEEYLSKEGRYYNGKSSFDVNKLYCKSTISGDAFDWHRTIDEIANRLKNKINSLYI